MYSYFYLLSQGLAKIVASMMAVKFNKRSLRDQVSGHVYPDFNQVIFILSTAWLPITIGQVKPVESKK